MGAGAPRRRLPNQGDKKCGLFFYEKKIAARSEEWLTCRMRDSPYYAFSLGCGLIMFSWVLFVMLVQ
jgi:hypothetical protein